MLVEGTGSHLQSTGYPHMPRRPASLMMPSLRPSAHPDDDSEGMPDSYAPNFTDEPQAEWEYIRGSPSEERAGICTHNDWSPKINIKSWLDTSLGILHSGQLS